VLPAAHPWGYRNTAYLRVQPASGRVGYHAAGSNRLQDIAADPLLLPALNEALSGLRRVLTSTTATAEQPALDAVTLRGSAAYGYAVALLHGRGRLDELACRWREDVPALAAVEPAQHQGITLHEELAGVVFSLSPRSFFQAHTAQAAVLLDSVRSLLDLQPHERLLDAYSGVGTFALPLAQQVREVLAIEAQEQAVSDGRRTARFNGIDNVTFLAAPMERVGSETLAPAHAPIHAAILDPPRRGCHPAVLQTLSRLAPARIAYVSCHPGTLARDVRHLLDSGYRLRMVQPVDLFPQTPHIECVALLTR
jgi:23S rRNA (uracil1939-C5)-methyltransferase